MAYAVYQDAVDQYGEAYVLSSVTALDPDDGTPVPEATAAFNKAAAKASSEMDSYLGVVYSTPVTPVADILVRFCVDISLYLASIDAGSGTDEKRRRYEDALAWLKRIADGKAVLVTDGEEAEAPVNEHLPVLSAPARLFSRSTMGGL
jgi:phage gp36-like protein